MEANYELTPGESMICPHPGCGKIFYSRWSMARHVRIHTGEKVTLAY